MAGLAAKIISYFFHPLLMTSLLFGMLFLGNSPVTRPLGSFIGPFILIIFLVTFVIPVISISFLRITKNIKSLALNDRKERILPFVFISIFYATITFMFIYQKSITMEINLIMVAISLIIILVTIFTFFYKISAHGAGVGGMLGFILAFHVITPASEMLMILVSLIVLGGAVLSARLYLDVHTPREVYHGLLLGFVISFVSIILYG